MAQPPGTLIFLHIHKTAGTSLRQLLVRRFRPGRVYAMDQHYFGLQQAVDALAARAPAERRQIDCLIGHVAYGIHELLPRPPRYLTFLREPVARTLSEYYYLRSAPAPHIRRLLDGKSALTPYERRFREHLRPESTPANSLEAFLEMFHESGSLDLQTRMVGGFVPPGGYVRPYPPLPADALERAKRNLREHIEMLGLVERFDESVLLLQAKLGWGDAYYTVENTRRGSLHRAPLPKATLARVEQHCALDIELYRYAQALFAERIRELPGPAAEAAVRRFRRRNRLYQNLHLAYRYSGLRRLRALLAGLRPLSRAR